MPHFKLFNVLVLTVSLTACQMIGDQYQRPETELPQTYSQQDAQQAALAPTQWWTLFNDAQLNALIEKALENNTNIHAAVARIEEADARAREVGAALLPSVDLGAGAVRNRVSEAGAFPAFGSNPRNNYNIGLNSSIEIDFWGKLKRAKEVARADYLASRYAKETVIWSLTGLVANQYLLVRSLDSQLAVNADNQKISDESLALVKRRLAGGIASKLDVQQAELVLADLKSQALELNRLRAVTEHQLAILTGDLGLKIEQAALLALPVPPSPPAGLPSSLMETRPDVRQAEQALVAANANIAIAKAAFYPSVSLTGSLGGESVELGDMLKSAARVWSLGLSLDLPIFNAGKLDAREQQATAQQKQVLAQYQGSVQTAFQEVNDALVGVRVYRQSEAIAQSKQAIAKDMLRIAQNRYKAGYSAYLDVLDAQRTHHDATLGFVQNRQNLLIATVDLFKALGGGWQDTVQTQAAEKQ